MDDEKEYLFDVSDNEDEDFGCYVTIVERSFFEENGYLDSRHLTDELKGKLPEAIIDEVQESIFVSELDKDGTVEALKANGFIYEPKITQGFDN